MTAPREPRIHIAGLGPGDPGHVTIETRALLASGLPVLLRTRHHPSAAELAPAARDCDDLYRGADSFEAAYDAIAGRVLELAAAGPLVFAVPGHPLFAERSVSLVLDRAATRSIPVKVHPAVSFVDLAAAALAVDMGAIQVVDATALRIDAQRPALIHQVYDRESVSALKLALLDVYPPDHPVTVLSALGSSTESIRQVPLHDLDHRPFGYLDTLFVPGLPALEDLRRMDGLLHVIDRLNAPDGCPWDREQTHLSLRPTCWRKPTKPSKRSTAMTPSRSPRNSAMSSSRC